MTVAGALVAACVGAMVGELCGAEDARATSGTGGVSGTITCEAHAATQISTHAAASWRSHRNRDIPGPYYYVSGEPLRTGGPSLGSSDR